MYRILRPRLIWATPRLSRVINMAATSSAGSSGDCRSVDLLVLVLLDFGDIFSAQIRWCTLRNLIYFCKIACNLMILILYYNDIVYHVSGVLWDVHRAQECISETEIKIGTQNQVSEISCPSLEILLIYTLLHRGRGRLLCFTDSPWQLCYTYVVTTSQ